MFILDECDKVLENVGKYTAFFEFMALNLTDIVFVIKTCAVTSNRFSRKHLMENR